MHTEAYQQMNVLLNQYTKSDANVRATLDIQQSVNVLDVGSFDVNGNYRNHVESRRWKYTGMDIFPGKNVDIVSSSEYKFPFDYNSFDIVMSGSTMEHVQAVWLWIPELVRVLKPGGMLAVITHTHWRFHPHPVDCWRIMPDGMRYLFDLTNRLERYDINMYCDTDISATAWKTQHNIRRQYE